MKAVYPVILTKAQKEVLVEVPDFNIFTEGNDLHDAIVMARDAIGLQGISLQDQKEAIPAATRLEEIDISRGKFFDQGESMLTLVDIDFEIYKQRLD